MSENQSHETISTKEFLWNMNQKLDGMQAFMNKFYEVFATQKQFLELEQEIKRELDKRDTKLEKLQEKNDRLSIKFGFISGAMFVLMLVKDAIIQAIFNGFNSKP